MSDIYWNSHRQCFSLREGGLVRDYLAAFHMKNPVFLVSPRGQARVRRTGRKEVHAFIRGTARVLGETPLDPRGRRVLYNPYVNDSFVDEANLPVHAGQSAIGIVRGGRPEIYVE